MTRVADPRAADARLARERLETPDRVLPTGSSVVTTEVTPPQSQRRGFSRTRRVLGIFLTLAFFAGVAAWAVLLSPRGIGGPASYVLVSGASMEPLLHGGDVVVARERSSYNVGDVVAYRVPKGEAGAGSIVIHRIVGGNERGYVLKGDNRSGHDLWHPPKTDVLGEMWFSVPGGGRYLVRLRAPLAAASLAGVFIFLLVLTTKPRRRPSAH